MRWIEIIIFLLICSGLFNILGIHFTDFINILINTKKSTLKDEIDVLLGTPVKGFFNKESFEIEQLLKATGRENKFDTLKKASLIMFVIGALFSLLIDNVFLIPILGAGFALTPLWYIRSTAMVYKKHLNEELETAISIVTTSYLRTGDILKSIKENIPYINQPVRIHFETFVTEAEILNANLISAINTLKMKIPNRIFHEWCNTLIQCQSDRSMKNALSFTVQKFSDIRIVQSELEAIINEPKREAITMMLLVLFNIPLLYILNHSWFNTLMFSTPGKITLAFSSGLVLFAYSRIMKLSKPIEYKG